MDFIMILKEQHRISLGKGDLNHSIIYHEFATIVEDSGFAMEQAKVVHFQSTIDVSSTYTSSTWNMVSRILLKSIKTHLRDPKYFSILISIKSQVIELHEIVTVLGVFYFLKFDTMCIAYIKY